MALLAAALVVAEQTNRAPVTPSAAKPNSAPTMTNKTDKLEKSDAEWRRELTPAQYQVLRQKGTERPFTGEFWNSHDAGVYHCAGCGAVLFASDAKFDSGCGWPSFDKPKDGAAVAESSDGSHGMERTEVLCSKCGGHLGHVFDDGPTKTKLRYCINSAALKFEGTNAPSAKK
jgi:peptide-methionine (R)-S-oxide reductase